MLQLLRLPKSTVPVGKAGRIIIQIDGNRGAAVLRPLGSLEVVLHPAEVAQVSIKFIELIPSP